MNVMRFFKDKSCFRANWLKIAALVLIMAMGASMQSEAREVNVHGRVTHRKTGEPLVFVSVYNVETGKLIGATNEEGRYTVNIDSEGTLEFSILGCEDYSEPVNGRLTIDVVLEPSAVVLNEVVVEAKRLGNAVITEPTDINVKGNYLYIKTHVKIPRELFSSNVRLVIQPDIFNITRKQQLLLKPLVFDGKRYHITQDRMYDFDAAACDPLWKYTQVKKTGRGVDDVVTIADSVYVADPSEDYKCDLMVAMENYNRVLYRDTVVIGRGVVNPLRFLDFSLAGSPVVDEAFFPSPEMQLRDTRGDINLTFAVGRTNLDLSMGDNRSELNKLASQIRAIERDPNSALKSFKIVGTASPEGNYNRNLQLAQGRMKSAIEAITADLDPSSKRNVEISTDAQVESWATMASMMRADGHAEEAAAVEDLISKHHDPTRLWHAIYRLPFYKSLITDTYLPRLRRVSYEMVSSQYRYLTDAEIAELYAKDPTALSRYEFWRLYTTSEQPDKKREIIEKCIAAHPSFVVAATDLAAMKIADNEPDLTLLEPFIANEKLRIPDETRLNQAIAMLAAKNFTGADSLASILPDAPTFHKAKIYAQALNGRYSEVMQEISEDSPFNEVLLLLAIKANEKAWKKAQSLGDSAKEEYVKAVAANRVDEYMAAVKHLENAFNLDPSLREIAKVDGDIIDLLEDI